VKLLFDQNLSHQLARAVSASFSGSQHVRDVGLSEADDDEVWAFAKEHGFTIISKDSDFHQRSLLYGAPPKVIWIRTGNCTTTELRDLIVRHYPALLKFGSEQYGAFLEIG
jgi:predicted nuclease of predicted toxin-antitoxin system